MIENADRIIQTGNRHSLNRLRFSIIELHPRRARRNCRGQIERNCIHGSDGPDTAAVELAYFFSTLDLSEY